VEQREREATFTKENVDAALLLRPWGSERAIALLEGKNKHVDRLGYIFLANNNRNTVLMYVSVDSDNQ
jgi:hypothetical protein